MSCWPVVTAISPGPVAPAELYETTTVTGGCLFSPSCGGGGGAALDLEREGSLLL
jgi:hypothetical protein